MSIFAVTFSGIAVSAAQDVFELAGPARPLPIGWNDSRTLRHRHEPLSCSSRARPKRRSRRLGHVHAAALVPATRSMKSLVVSAQRNTGAAEQWSV